MYCRRLCSTVVSGICRASQRKGITGDLGAEPGGRDKARTPCEEVGGQTSVGPVIDFDVVNDSHQSSHVDLNHFA